MQRILLFLLSVGMLLGCDCGTTSPIGTGGGTSGATGGGTANGGGTASAGGGIETGGGSPSGGGTAGGQAGGTGGGLNLDGGSALTCESLTKTYSEALANAKTCIPPLDLNDPCTGRVPSTLGCGCETSVDATKKATVQAVYDAASKIFSQNRCQAACPRCVLIGTATCDKANALVCVDKFR
jgi:hypothetical protein